MLEFLPNSLNWTGKKKKNFMAFFYGWSSTTTRLEPLQKSRQFTTKFSEIPDTHQPQKDEMLSQPWSHPVVWNTGPLY